MSMATESVIHTLTKKEIRPMIVLWVVLFAGTLYFSELSTRALGAAFCAWLGGIVTAELDRVFDVVNRLARKKKEYAHV